MLRVTGLEGAGVNEKWDGTVDLTPRSVLNARARGLAPRDVAAPVPAVTAPVAPSAPPVEAAPAPQAAAPEQSAAPTVETAAAEAPKPRARKAKPAAPQGEGGEA